MKPLSLDHVVVNVSDMNRARDFYERVLGAEIVEFGAGRKAVQIDHQKLNLHDAGSRSDPIVRHPAVERRAGRGGRQGDRTDDNGRVARPWPILARQQGEER